MSWSDRSMPPSRASISGLSRYSIGAALARGALRQFGHAPRLVTADAGFFSAANEAATGALGVQRISMPNHSSKSPQRRLLERKRWFREAQRWRTGCEGRISLLKRRHGLNRCRYKGLDGMKRWVGLGVIADNLINMGLALNPAAD